MSTSGVSGLILAGGQGRRMGGLDKGLVPWQGRPLAAWVVERLRPQVSEVLISANRHAASYAALGANVVADTQPGYAGPLAGMAAGMARAREPLLVVAPCDVPLLPNDYVARLCAALAPEADAVVAVAGGRVQPVHCMLRCRLLPALQAFLLGGERRVEAWFDSLRVGRAEFGSDAGILAGANTPGELAALGDVARETR